MATNRQAVLDQAMRWAADARTRLRWNRVANNCFEGDALFLWAARQPAGAPPPAAVEATGVNCFEIFMLAMCHADPDRAATHDRMRTIFFDAAGQSGLGPPGFDPWPELLTRAGTLTRWDPLAGAIPLPGQLVFLNRSSHVVMASRLRPEPERAYMSRLDVLSFYGNYPALPARTDTPTPVAVATLAQIRDYYCALQNFALRANSPPFTAADVTIEFGDPFWA